MQFNLEEKRPSEKNIYHLLVLVCQARPSLLSYKVTTIHYGITSINALIIINGSEHL